MRTVKLLTMLFVLAWLGKMHAQHCSTYVQPPNDLVKDGAMDYYTWTNCSTMAQLTGSGGPPYNYPYACCQWTHPTGVGNDYCTPDFFHTCAPTPLYSSGGTILNAGLSANANINWQNFVAGSPVTAFVPLSPHGGNGYSGMMLWQNQTYDNREYVSNQLVSTLQPGWTYQVSMWVRLSGNSAYGIKDISILFSNSLPSQSVISPFIQAIVPGSNDLLVSMSSSVITDKSNWTHLTASVTMPIGSSFNYITIGNFVSNTATTKTGPLAAGSNGGTVHSYYYIDDVSITVENCAPYIEFAGSSVEICEGTTGSLSIQSPTGNNYNMMVIDMNNNSIIYNAAPTSNVPVSPTVTTTYQVIITDLNNPSCTNTAYFTVNVIPGPDASFSPWFLGNSLQLQSGTPGTHNWEVWGSYTGNVGTYTYVGNYDYNYFALNAGVNCYFIKHTVTNECGTACKAISVCNANCDWQPCGLQVPTNLYIDYSTYTFNWNAVPGADHYVIEIILDDPSCCGDPAGPLSFLSIRTITSYTNSHTLNYAADFGDMIWSCYSWRVLAVCPNGASTLSDPQCVGGGHDHRSMPADHNNVNVEGLTTLRVFPNPTKGLTTFEIETAKDIEFNIDIFDVNGKSIKTFSNVKSTGKRTLVNWDTESFSKGTYLVRVTTSDQQVINSTLIVE
jgi:hypothetical protein